MLPPIVLDLDGSGAGKANITVRFDVTGDGKAEAVSWISAGQAFLALDRDHSGKIESGAEISFVQDLAGAKTDLEGLAAYDSNGDRVFNAQDQRFGEFLVWQDADSDGVSDAGELKSLAEAGIASIDLTIDKQIPAAGDRVLVYGTSTFTRTDGTTGTVGDVALTWEHGQGSADGEGARLPVLPSPSGSLASADGQLGRLRQALSGDPFAGGQAKAGGGEPQEFAAFDPKVVQMVQAMASFGAVSGASDLLRRQVQIDTGVDWFGASAA